MCKESYIIEKPKESGVQMKQLSVEDMVWSIGIFAGVDMGCKDGLASGDQLA